MVFIPWDKYEIYGHSDGIVKSLSNTNIASLVKDGGGLNCVTWCRYCESVDCVFM